MRKYIYAVLVIIVLIISAYFRLGFSNEIVFKGDENNTIVEWFERVENKEFPILINKGKSGMYTINIYRLFWYALMHFVKDPRWFTLISISIPCVLAVVLCFLFCYRFIDKKTAFFAAALYGFSGWAILYSKNLWGVNLLQLFSVLLFYCLSVCFYKNSRWNMVAVLLILMLVPGFHPTGFSIYISVFLIVLIRQYKSRTFQKYIRSRWENLFPQRDVLPFYGNTGGAGKVRDKQFKRYMIFIIPLAIIAVFFISNRVDMAAFNLKALFTSIRLLVVDGWYYGYLDVPSRFPATESVCITFIRLMFIIGCIYTIKRMVLDGKTGKFSPYIIVGMWYFVFLITFGFTNLTSYGHYFMVVLPVLFIIAAIGFRSVVDYILENEKIQNWELVLLFFILMLWNPWIVLLLIVLLLLLRNKVKYKILKIFKKLSVYFLYACIAFILVFQVLSNYQLFAYIRNEGGVPGVPGLDLGSKINAVRYVINDAQKRYKETGLKSVYLIINDESYKYLFDYLMDLQQVDCFSEEELSHGYRYKIIGDVVRNFDIKKTENYLTHIRISSKLVIVEEINEE